MKKSILIAAAVVIVLLSNAVSWYIGRHEIYMAADVHPDGSESIWYPHSFDYKEYWMAERAFATQYIELINSVYENNREVFDNVLTESPEWDKLIQLYNKDLELPDTTQWSWEQMYNL